MRKYTTILLEFLTIVISISLLCSPILLPNEYESPDLSASLRLTQGNFITDANPPVIIGPADFSFLVNLSGNHVSWYISDPDPRNYSILHNYIYVEAQRNRTWTKNGPVGMIIDFLPIGVHIFTLIVDDSWGNQNSDNVQVTVLDTTNIVTFPISTTDPINLSVLLDFLSSLGINIAIITLLILILVSSNRYLKRRSLASKLPPIDPLMLELLNEDEI